MPRKSKVVTKSRTGKSTASIADVLKQKRSIIVTDPKGGIAVTKRTKGRKVATVNPLDVIKPEIFRYADPDAEALAAARLARFAGPQPEPKPKAKRPR